MRLAANQIEADLPREYPGRRIREWYHTLVTGDVEGGMSSRELVVLVEGLTDGSEFKRLMGSGWSTAELILARLANDFRAAHTEEGHAPIDPLVPPAYRDETESDADSLSGDQIERMLDGDMTVYTELELAA